MPKESLEKKRAQLELLEKRVEEKQKRLQELDKQCEKEVKLQEERHAQNENMDCRIPVDDNAVKVRHQRLIAYKRQRQIIHDQSREKHLSLSLSDAYMKTLEKELTSLKDDELVSARKNHEKRHAKLVAFLRMMYGSAITRNSDRPSYRMVIRIIDMLLVHVDNGITGSELRQVCFVLFCCYIVFRHLQWVS